jgi:BCD family chlorophyll transporter-like MFS transporter
MALVLAIGTLNRVMIVELGVSAGLVATMIALPLVFAPFRAIIGFNSDVHRSELGWRRVPYIWKGTMLQFGGLSIMPFALLVLAGAGEARDASPWIGHAGAALAFLLVGAGLHTTQTVGLALATDLAPPEQRPKVVGLMYTMLLLGMIVSALLFGWLLAEFSPGRLVQVIQGAALATMVLNVIALWKQETRRPARFVAPRARPSFRDEWAVYAAGPHAIRRLIAVGLGTMGFSMADVLLEPYGGKILGLPVGATTALTATLAFGGLAGFAFASRVLSRGADPFRMACAGAVVGMASFAIVIVAAPLEHPAVFALGTLLIGLGGGLFGHGTLTATMDAAPKDQAGLALGAWGAAQATAAGVAVAIGGLLHDAVAASRLGEAMGPATAYVTVYLLELCLLCAAAVAMAPLLRAPARRAALTRHAA